MKRSMLAAAVALIGSAATLSSAAEPVPNEFKLIEATVPQIQQALGSRLLSSEELVQMYLARIAAYDDAGPKLNSFIYLNPNAAAQAKSIDSNRFLPGHQVRPLPVGRCLHHPQAA